MPKLPSVSGDRVVRALKRTGFVELRQKGSHVSLEERASDRVCKTVLPMHSELAKGTLSDILKQCGLSLQEFLELYRVHASSSRCILQDIHLHAVESIRGISEAQRCEVCFKLP